MSVCFFFQIRKNEDMESFEDNKELDLFVSVWTVQATTTLKLKLNHVTMALKYFARITTSLYKGSITEFIRASTNYGENLKFSKVATVVATDEFKWKKSTTLKILNVLKKILFQTETSEEFVNTIRVLWPRKAPTNKIIGKSFGKNEIVTKKFEEWISIIKQHTRNRSDASIRNILTFFKTTCVLKFKLDLLNWPENANKHVETLIEQNPMLLQEVLGNIDSQQSKKKFVWLQLFISKIIKSSETVVYPFVHASDAKESDDGTDHHRIDSQELDKIYEESKKNIQHELLYLLMITTGLRVGATSRIQLQHIVEIKNGHVAIKEQGRTIEKGKKWVSFLLTFRIRELLHTWITKHRKVDDNVYLFPGYAGNSSISTETIRNILRNLCKNIGLVGKKYHPHALRHSYAHILLENGNAPEIVAKLMNHSSSKTTEKFYLKENAIEVNARANIPWMKDTKNLKRKDPTPTFLNDVTDAKQRAEKHERKKRKIERQTQQLMMLDSLRKPFN